MRPIGSTKRCTHAQVNTCGCPSTVQLILLADGEAVRVGVDPISSREDIPQDCLVVTVPFDKYGTGKSGESDGFRRCCRSGPLLYENHLCNANMARCVSQKLRTVVDGKPCVDLVGSSDSDEIPNPRITSLV